MRDNWFFEAADLRMWQACDGSREKKKRTELIALSHRTPNPTIAALPNAAITSLTFTPEVRRQSWPARDLGNLPGYVGANRDS